MWQGNRAMQRVLPTSHDSDCYLLQLTKGQGRYSTGSPTVACRLKADWMWNWKEINSNNMAHAFWNWVHNDPSRSSKVIDLRTSRKRAYDFLLGLPDLPYFTGAPVFQVISPVSRLKPIWETLSPVFRLLWILLHDLAVLQIYQQRKLVTQQL